MTKITINLKVTPELVRWAKNQVWKAGEVVLTDGAITLDGTVHMLRQSFNAIARMGLIDTPQSARVVFAAYDPNGDRHQITSKSLEYSYCVAYREDGEKELQRVLEYYGTPKCVQDDYDEHLKDLATDNPDTGWVGTYARDQIGEAKNLQEYFERQYEKQVAPIKEKIAAGGFDKYLVPTSYWFFMREDAEARADRCRLWGYKDVVVLQGKRE
jgi:hypothetical protein